MAAGACRYSVSRHRAAARFNITRGMRRAGNDEGHEWLGAFDSSAEESLVIKGLEPLQAVFDAQMSSGPLPDEYKDARTLAVALVIVGSAVATNGVAAHQPSAMPVVGDRARSLRVSGADCRTKRANSGCLIQATAFVLARFDTITTCVIRSTAC
jgi:hypothetical protein